MRMALLRWVRKTSKKTKFGAASPLHFRVGMEAWDSGNYRYVTACGREYPEDRAVWYTTPYVGEVSCSECRTSWTYIETQICREDNPPDLGERYIIWTQEAVRMVASVLTHLARL